MKNIVIIAVGLFIIIVTALIRAYAGFKLYGWFMVPIGMPVIPMAQLYGAMFFFSFLIQHATNSDEKKNEGKSVTQMLIEALFTTLVYTGLWLLFGYIIKSIIY